MDPTAVRPSASSPLPHVLVLTLSFQIHSSLSFCDLVPCGRKIGGRCTKFTKLQPIYMFILELEGKGKALDEKIFSVLII